MRQLQSKWALTLLIAAMQHGVVGCNRAGHDGHDHAHGGAEDEPETLAITKWTERYELFVELPPPLPGKPVPYHAHVTRLEGFQAVTEGTFRVRFKTPGGVAAEALAQGVKRPGIFVFDAPVPAAATVNSCIWLTCAYSFWRATAFHPLFIPVAVALVDSV